jgi:hypothetical protein
MKIKNLISEGLLVIKRVNYWEDSKYSPEKLEASVPMDIKLILIRYKGIDGEAWFLNPPEDSIPLKDGLSSIEHYQKVIDYFKNMRKEGLCDLIYLANAESELPPRLTSNGWFFCGYDYGMYLGEYNSWSVVFQEILFGQIPGMREFAKRLNTNLLFDKLEDAFELGVKRSEYVKSEYAQFLETIEEGEEFGPIAIYGVNI